MDKKIDGLEILEYNGIGYNRTKFFESWRVAFLNWSENFDKSSAFPPERHFLTDEVFVLLSGRAVLEVGDRLDKVVLEPNKIYNVLKGEWHRVTVSRDAKLLVVENHSTCLENSEYMNPSPKKNIDEI